MKTYATSGTRFIIPDNWADVGRLYRDSQVILDNETPVDWPLPKIKRLVPLRLIYLQEDISTGDKQLVLSEDIDE